MKIVRLISVRGFIVAIYCSNKQYYLEMLDLTGKYYIHPDPFTHAITAKIEAFSLIDRAKEEMKRRNTNGY